LFSGTVAENLRLTNSDATEEMMEEALKNACAYEFVSALPNGVHTRVGENGSRLSKGQIQRLALARAILSDSPILLLDEATSALDVRTERKLLENIMKCRKGRTCIITTHKSSVLAISQKAYLIKDRDITFIEKEQAEQIMKNM
jgi:ABC-type multidrug transport system fused ATPase/permease subunit